jgi:outer membrane protein TolC
MKRPLTAKGILVSGLAVSCAFMLPATVLQPAIAQDKPVPAQSAAVAETDIPTNPVAQAEKDGTAYPLSLKELTKLALQNNLDIAIQDTNEELSQMRVFQALGPYDPSVSVTAGVRSILSPNTNQVNRSTQGPANSLTTDTWNFTLSKNTPTGGGLQLSLNSNRQDTNQLFALFNPQYNASASRSRCFGTAASTSTAVRSSCITWT